MIPSHLSKPLAIIAMRASILACKFGLALFISRYLDLAALGVFGLVAGAVAVGPVLLGLGMMNLITREAVTLPAIDLVDHLRHYWCFTVSAYALVLLLTGLLTVAIGVSELWILVVLIILFEHLGTDVFQLLSNLERPLSANVNNFLRGAAWVLVYIALSLWIPSLRSISILLAFWLGGSVIAFMLFLWTVRSWPWGAAFALPLRQNWITTTIRRAFVIYVSDLAFIASQYIDRYLVTFFLGLKFAGIYFLYWSFANAASTLVSLTVLHVQRPLLIKAYHQGGPPLHRRLAASFARPTALASLAFGGAIGLFFHTVLPFLDQQAIASNLSAFWLLNVAMVARNMADFGAIVLFTTRRDTLMTVTNIAAVLILALAQTLLLPVGGLYGAGGAILITFTGVALWRFRAIFGRWNIAPMLRRVGPKRGHHGTGKAGSLETACRSRRSASGTS